MSRKCSISKKGPLSGNNRSHSRRATRRVQNVNVQNFSVKINGKLRKIKMSVRAHKNFIKNSKNK